MKKEIVLITWLDSTTDAGWRYGEVNTELIPIHSVGFLIKATKQAVTIAATQGSQGHGLLDPLTIPYGSILKIIKVPVKDAQFAAR